MIGDSGTNFAISTVEINTGIAPIRNRNCQLRCSTIRPLSTRPTPPPIPNTELTVPIATPTLWGGNSSRMIPKLSGKIAAPAPCSARKPISTPMFGASVAPRLAKPKIPSDTTSSFFFPCASPSLPMIGVSTLELTRKLVTIQVTHAGDVSNSSTKNGSDGITSVCMIANEIPATVSRLRVSLWEWAGTRVSLPVPARPGEGVPPPTPVRLAARELAGILGRGETSARRVMARCA